MPRQPLPATRTNWRTWPHSRWAFQNLDRLLPSRPVHAPPRPAPLPRAPLDLDGLRIDDGSVGGLDWQAYLARTHTDAFVALHEGRLIVEHYAGGMRRGQRHMLFSVTKSLVGLVAERLAADGAIDLRIRIDALVPELAGSAFADTDLRALLDMRDGVAFNEDYADPAADIHRYSRAYWGDDPGGVRRRLGLIEANRRQPGRFAYRTPVADVVGWALERATGRDLPELLSAYVWQPIGAEHDGQLVLDNAGDACAGTGFNTTAIDIARLGQALLANPASPLSSAFAAIATGGDRAAFAAAAPPSRAGWSYRSFWWVMHDNVGSVAALGVFGQRLVVRPGDGLVIVRLATQPTAANQPSDALHAAAFEALARRVAARG